MISFLGLQEKDLTRLALLQKADGSYSLDDRLASIVGINIRTLQEEGEKNDWDPEAWATVTVLAYFTARLTSFSEDWELLADKSKLWLSEHYEDTVVEEMFERALSFFPVA
ncbi:unnamed protein product [Allacma fusca]|uniref:Uncharacterized protein n=1 Tax=Allacma fusca TaxID=39272 RepID=A0A8J2M9Z4_9HEXA|nr:unnamed protein product [Allacma fusca]